MTAFEALRLTRGTWKRTPRGNVACPVCQAEIFWADYARARHLTRHLREGWSPLQLAGAPPDRTLPSPTEPYLA